MTEDGLEYSGGFIQLSVLSYICAGVFGGVAGLFGVLGLCGCGNRTVMFSLAGVSLFFAGVFYGFGNKRMKIEKLAAGPQELIPSPAKYFTEQDTAVQRTSSFTSNDTLILVFEETH